MSFADYIKSTSPTKQMAKEFVKAMALRAKMEGDSTCIIDIPSISPFDFTLDDCKEAAKALGFHDATICVIHGSVSVGSVWLSFSIT